MSSSFISFLLFSCLTLLHLPPLSSAKSIFRSQLIYEPTGETPPTAYFEVKKPISLPNTNPCSYLILQHEFAFTYGKPPVLTNYTPPFNCDSHSFSKIILEWTATSKGRQFDRIFGVWLSGVEILRSCTAEPRATGIVWTVKKDITRYYSLLMKDQTLAVYLGNLVDSTYTGVYNVNVTFHFYPHEKGYVDSGNLFDTGADLILPISRNLPLSDGLWFEIRDSGSVEYSNEFFIPRNAYRAVVEVYVSFHENDEFWYSNYPNEYLSANNLTGVAGNGPFREVIVSLDDSVVGAIWPFTVIYTGGLNPLLWRPISGIGSFDLPSYDIDITPFLGTILDGKSHKFSFSVTNALNIWYVDANLHVWLDDKSETTQGKLVEHETSPLSSSLTSNFTGLDGIFVTNFSRSIVSSGWVKSSRGVIFTKSFQKFEYSNNMVITNDGNSQILDQVIGSNSSVETKIPSSSIRSTRSLRKFGLRLYSGVVDKGNGTYDSLTNVTLGFDEKKQKNLDIGLFTSSRLKNLQNGQGYIVVKGNLVVSGLGSTQQEYDYKGDNSCYFRNLRSSNYTILQNKESDTCASDRVVEFEGSRYRGKTKGLI